MREHNFYKHHANHDQGDDDINDKPHIIQFDLYHNGKLYVYDVVDANNDCFPTPLDGAARVAAIDRFLDHVDAVQLVAALNRRPDLVAADDDGRVWLPGVVDEQRDVPKQRDFGERVHAVEQYLDGLAKHFLYGNGPIGGCDFGQASGQWLSARNGQ